jgi:hypothetical protein
VLCLCFLRMLIVQLGYGPCCATLSASAAPPAHFSTAELPIKYSLHVQPLQFAHPQPPHQQPKPHPPAPPKSAVLAMAVLLAPEPPAVKDERERRSKQPFVGYSCLLYAGTPLAAQQVLLTGLGLQLGLGQGLGGERGGGEGRPQGAFSSLFRHPPNFISSNLGASKNI